VDRPLPWLRYVDADDLDGGDLALNGIKVRDAAGETLGSVDGVIVDVQTGRPYYLVVDSGGWFKSKDFLLPIGHTRLDPARDALIADVSKERIDRFPGFDKDKFEELSEDELRTMNDSICVASSVSGAVNYSPTAPFSAAWERPDYDQPGWWKYDTSRYLSTQSRSDRASTAGAFRGGEYATDPSVRSREAVTAQGGDVSPHPGGRAQPGDVLGVETGGEQTHIGETSEDEDKRRIDAERSVGRSRKS
jgi:hypothetical protein